MQEGMTGTFKRIGMQEHEALIQSGGFSPLALAPPSCHVELTRTVTELAGETYSPVQSSNTVDVASDAADVIETSNAGLMRGLGGTFSLFFVTGLVMWSVL